MKKVLMSMLLVCLTLCLFVGCSDSPKVNTLPEPIDKSLYTMKSGSTWFSTLTTGTDIQRTSITDIVFCKETPSGTLKVNGVDLTKDETGKVKGYVEENTSQSGYYKIYIVGDYIFGNEVMDQMFKGFTSLTDLNFGHFDTSSVKYMSGMFQDCSELSSLDLSSFDTSSVENMNGMFYNCSKLTSLNLSNFDTSSVKNMSNMFSGCSGLTTLDLSKLNTSNVTSMEGMFYNCSKLTSLNLSNFDTSKVTIMIKMFSGCSSLTTLNLSNFNTSKVIDMNNMFNNCSSLPNLNLSSFVITGSPISANMFINCGKSHTTITINKDYKTFFDGVLTSTDINYYWDYSESTYTKKPRD